LAVSANRWHPLAFNARSYGLRWSVARSLFSHMSGALPPPRLLGAIDTRSPTTLPPSHRRRFLFHFYNAASIVTCYSPPAIAGVRTGRRHRRRRQSTRHRRRTAVLAKISHANCRTTLTNRPSRDRRDRFVRVVQQSACEVFQRTAVCTGHRPRRRRQYTSNRRCTHRAPSPAPSAVHPRLQAYAQGAVTGAVGSPPAIAGVRTGHRHRRRRQCTRDRRRAHRTLSPAPSAVYPRSQAWAHGAVTGAVRSLYPVTL